MLGLLRKMTIEAYSKADYSGAPVGKFEVMFNPTVYSQKFEAQYFDEQGQGSSGSPQVFDKLKPQEYTFDFVIDGTGSTGVLKEVTTEIQNFLRVAWKMNPETHRPNYLKLYWGQLVSQCVLKTADVNYNLFRPDGSPLRAKITAVFSENIEDVKRAAQEKKKSPDLTRVMTVKESDNISLMSYYAYDDPAYYIQVAKKNNISNFRKLSKGQRLVFPPVNNNRKE